MNLIYFTLAIIIGAIAGTFTGLLPAIHINLVSSILVQNFTETSYDTSLFLVIFIISMSITHTFIDYIPSIFFGAPDSDTVFSILPGHRFLLKGYGYYAVILTLYGSLVALFIILFFTPLFIFILPFIYSYIKKLIPFILIFVSLFMILKEKNKFYAFFIFLLAGSLGVSTLNLNIKQPLLPLLTGLFGGSNLIISIKQKVKLPKQKILSLKKIKLRRKFLRKAILSSALTAPLTAFLPGLGASQAALIGKEISGDIGQRGFLFLLGAINTIVMGLSFITFYSINKTRTASALAISQLLQNKISFSFLLIILISLITSGILASFLTIAFSKLISKKISKINYSSLSKFILVFLIFIVFLLSGFIGLLIFITSTFLGLSAILLKIKRTHLMGSLIIPTLIFYLL